MPVKTAETLLADPRTTVGQFLDVLTWLNKDVLHLRVRKKCAQKQEYIDQIDSEIRQIENAIELVRRRIEEKCIN